VNASRHYDVVVLGRSLGALLAAALLARREFRVLLLGQGELPSRYRVGRQVLARRSFNLLAATSPVFRRVIQELAQTQKFRRLTDALDPMFSYVGHDVRFEVPPDIDLFSREIEREFPEVRQPIAEFYADISRLNGIIDGALEREAVWPPGTLFERLETGRLATALPNLAEGDATFPLLDRLPQQHAFKGVARLPAFFACNYGIDPRALPPLAMARLHGAWTRGVHALTGGEAAIEDFLIERIVAHGGACRLRSRATSLVVRRGRVVGVREDGEEEHIGTEAVVSSLNGEALAELSDGEGVTKKARENWPRVEVVGGHFTVALRVDPELWPAPLGHESFLVPKAPELPTLHVSRLPDGDDLEGQPKTLLVVAKSVVPDPLLDRLFGAREAVLATMREVFPFLDRHLWLVDSPHDGLPAWVYEQTPTGRTRRQIERVHLPEASTGPEPMQPRLEVKPLGYLGLAGEPVRGPVPGTYLLGPSVLPLLGQEGEVLAATSVVHILTSKDTKRQKRRRLMWTKLET
jgi:hypothetical protein